MPDAAPSLARPLPLARTVERLHAADEGALHAFLDEILDRAGEVEPRVRALLPEERRRERLLREASALVERWPDLEDRPPLFGVPVGVKDIIAVDGMPTRAGSALPADAFDMPEATVVRRLREAGAIVFGKTVTAEFASMSSNGTANPHDTRHTPGGSSSGSTAGVAAGYFPLALGTQTGGSIIRPAAFCGVAGLKPSHGRVPIDGVLAHAASVDTIGPFARDAEGLRIAASVMYDEWRRHEPREASSLSLVVPEGPYLQIASPEGLQPFEESVAQLDHAGVRVLRASFLDDVQEILERHSALMEAEFAREHEERFRRWGPLFSGGAAEAVDRGRSVSDERLQHLRASREELRARVAAFLDECGADAIVCPSAIGPAPRGLRSTGDPKMNAPWSHAGVPAVTLPAGAIGGLPVGLQFVGRFGADEALLAVAAALEHLVAG